MATLPDDDVFRAAISKVTSVGASADGDAAVMRARVALIPGADALAEQQAIRVLVREVDPYPLDDDYAAQDWRVGALQLAAALATSTERTTTTTWDIKKVVSQVEALARRRAEAAARALADAEAAEHARREAAEQTRRDAAERARREHLDWTAVAVELGIQNIYRAPDPASARQRFDGDLVAAQDEVGLVRAEREAQQIMAERRSTQLAVSLGLAGAAFVGAGWAFPRVIERPMGDANDASQQRFKTETTFNWGAAASAGFVGWLVGRFAGPWLLSHAGEIRRGAALVPRLGVA